MGLGVAVVDVGSSVDEELAVLEALVVATTEELVLEWFSELEEEVTVAEEVEDVVTEVLCSVAAGTGLVVVESSSLLLRVGVAAGGAELGVGSPGGGDEVSGAGVGEGAVVASGGGPAEAQVVDT